VLEADSGRPTLGLTYVAVNVLGGLAMAAAGLVLGRTIS
jgi:fluoride ion exporter CrcB/FEX